MSDSVADLIGRARALLTEAADRDPRLLTGQDIAAVESGLVALRTQTDALIASHAEAGESLELPRRSGRSSMTAWISRLTGCAPGEISTVLTTHRLVRHHTDALEAWRTGTLSTGKTRAVGEALDRLPSTFTAEETAVCEQALLTDARHLSVSGLRRRGNQLFEQVAPEAADQLLHDQLVREDLRAVAHTSCTIAPSGVPGLHTLTAHLPITEATKLATMLEAMVAPRRWHLRAHHAEGDLAALRPEQQRGQALCDLIGRLEPPCEAGGMTATVVVTVDHATLLGELGTATLATGEEVSAGEARRLACDAGILPAVLGGERQLLDVAPERRRHSRRQRVAIAHRDGGCCWEGCERPPGWCETHHLTPWSERGPTTVDNGALLCGYHHRLVHNGDWQTRLADDHVVEVIPPARIDPQRRPRRNERHLVQKPRC